MNFLCVLCDNSTDNKLFGLIFLCKNCHLQIVNCFDDYKYNCFKYDAPISDLIWRYKYESDLTAASVLTAYSSSKLVALIANYDALIPMPVNPKRLRQRGMHVSDYLLRKILRHSAVKKPIINTFNWRPIYSNPQQNLSSKARQDNIQPNHFAVPKTITNSVNSKFLVFDDVLTTGATWRALKANLPLGSDLFTVART